RDSRLRRGVRRAGYREQARFALNQQVVGLLVGVRAVRAVAGDRAADQPRIAAAELARRQAQSVGRAGREILDEHVGAGEQRGETARAVLAFHIKLDGLLAAVQPDEVTRLAAYCLVIVASEVASTGSLDLDDACTEVSKLPGGERRRYCLLQRDHGDAV